MIAFAVAAVVLLFLVADRFLLPAMQMIPGLDASGKKHLGAISRLVLVVVLFSLLALLLLLFRPGRMFLPGKPPPRTRTNYVDAWEESARRMETPPEDEGEKDEGDKNTT
jgi:hypothetical protein